METAVLIPLNSFVAAKSRLKDALTPTDREALVRWMADRVLAVARNARLTNRIAVVSPDDDVLAWVAARESIPLRQARGDLNAGLEEGRRWALESGAGALLVLLGDLPYLTPCDMVAMVTLDRNYRSSPHVVVAPDQLGQGTNAMLLRPPAALPFAFGEESFARHRSLARRLAVDVSVYRSAGTSRDVDTPEDVRELVASDLWRPSGPVNAPATTRWRAAEP